MPVRHHDKNIRSMPLAIKQLRHSPRELWLFYVLGFLDSLSYFMFSHVLMLHLTQGLELSDETAGIIYGVYGISISIFAILLGSVADQLQVRRTLLASASIETVVRFLLVAVASPRYPWLSAVLLFLPMSLSMGLGAPVISVGIRRFAIPEAIRTAYEINYVVMNSAAAISGPIIDGVRIMVSNEDGMIGTLRLHAFLILMTAVLELVHFIIALFIRDIEVIHNEETDDIYLRPVALRAVHLSEVVSVRLWVQRARKAWQDPNFRRLLVLNACLLWSKSAFRYLDAVYPIFIPRLFGQRTVASIPYMSLLSINPVIVIALTIPMGMLFQRLHPVPTMTIGSIITGFSPFFMTLGRHWWAVVAFIVQLSFGEIIWSPLSYEYTAKLAPVGEEGVYFALAGIPTFLSKFLSGPITGVLMAKFCPSEAHCRAFPIWFFIGCTTILGSILLLIFQNYVRVDEKNVDDDDDDKVQFDELEFEMSDMSL